MKAFMSPQLEEILKDPRARDELRNGLRRSHAVGTHAKPEAKKTKITTNSGATYQVQLVNLKGQ